MHHALTTQVEQRNLILINGFYSTYKITLFINHVLVDKGRLERFAVEFMERFSTQRVTLNFIHITPKITFTLLEAFGEILDIINQLIRTIVFNETYASAFGSQTHVDVFGYEHDFTWCAFVLQIKHRIEYAVVTGFVGEGFDGFLQFEVRQNRDGALAWVVFRNWNTF